MVTRINPACGDADFDYLFVKSPVVVTLTSVAFQERLTQQFAPTMQTHRSTQPRAETKVLPAGDLPAALFLESFVNEPAKGLVLVWLAALEVERKPDTDDEDGGINRAQPLGESETAADETEVLEQQY